MVGGLLKGYEKKVDVDQTVLTVEDRYGDRVDVNVRGTKHPFKLGDPVWWHGPNVFWTPLEFKVEDVKLEKIGYTRSSKVLF